MLPKYGAKPYQGQKRRPVCLISLVMLLIVACAGLGLTLYGAKIEHGRVWERLKDEELKVLSMQQRMAEVKVESVDQQSKTQEAERERDRVQNMLERTEQQVRDKNEEIQNLNDQLTNSNEAARKAQSRARELDATLTTKESEVHQLKKALNQYKQQVANLSQELEILRTRMKKSGLITDPQGIGAGFNANADELSQHHGAAHKVTVTGGLHDAISDNNRRRNAERQEQWQGGVDADIYDDGSQNEFPHDVI